MSCLQTWFAILILHQTMSSRWAVTTCILITMGPPCLAQSLGPHPSSGSTSVCQVLAWIVESVTHVYKFHVCRELCPSCSLWHLQGLKQHLAYSRC